MTRPDWDTHFLSRAELNAEMATCTRLKVGAVIVKNKRAIGDGFNGSPKGQAHCTDPGVGCLKNSEGRCVRTIHAEENAILESDRRLLEGATIYCSHEPCENCTKRIAQVGIVRVVFRHAYENEFNRHFNENIQWDHIPFPEQNTIK